MPVTAAVGQVVRQLLLLCYYNNYLIRRAVNIMSVLYFLKRHATKFIHLEALYHQSLLHRSHTPYQALPHKHTVEPLLWDTPIQGTPPFKFGHTQVWCTNLFKFQPCPPLEFQ